MPFTVDDFFAVFARYNVALWHLQIIAVLSGLVVTALLLRPSRMADRAILLILAAMWAVNGIGYHLLHFTPVNPAAPAFAGAFILQAGLLAARALHRTVAIVFNGEAGPRLWIGATLILYALVLYPALGHLFGHRWPAVPVFGVAPCPTTIFTIGVLLCGRWAALRWLLAIPVLWSIIGGSAAVLLDVPQDYGLIAAGVAALAGALFLRPAGSNPG
jgi:hypothetical protein